jgi:hypothetical protein
MHDTKNFFSGFLVVSHLDGQGSRPRDGLNKVAGGHIGGDAQLACLEHDIAVRAGARILRLRRIQKHRQQLVVLRANSQELGNQVIAYCKRRRLRSAWVRWPIRQKIQTGAKTSKQIQITAHTWEGFGHYS